MVCDDIVCELQDLRRLSWSERATSSGTSGMFLKTREGVGADAVFYKLSCYDEYRGIYGHECVNELLACRLMGLLGVDHARYQLVRALVVTDGVERQTWLARSCTFRRPGERKQALDLFYSLNKLPGESPLELCDRFEWHDRVREMMLVDYLIANRDRHGANIEVLKAPGAPPRLAPLFDNGLSFVFSCYGDEEQVRAFDVMGDIQANNYLGSRSLAYNLEHFAVRPDVRPLRETDRETLLAGLGDVLPTAHLDACWRMVWGRWCRYEALLRT